MIELSIGNDFWRGGTGLGEGREFEEEDGQLGECGPALQGERARL